MNGEERKLLEIMLERAIDIMRSLDSFVIQTEKRVNNQNGITDDEFDVITSDLADLDDAKRSIEDAVDIIIGVLEGVNG